MAALVPSSSPDASLTVVVDGSKAIAGTRSIEVAFAKMQKSGTDSISKMTKSMDSMDKMIAKVGASLIAFFGARALGQLFVGFLDRLIEINRVFTGFIATMNVVKGSTAASRREYEFLLGVANKLGVAVEGTTTQYAKLAASLKNVDKSGELTRHLFVAISEAAVVLHSRGRDVTLIFEAFQQMASKGKLSLEELQRQLGNTLPGAVGLAARAMGQSEAELREGIQKGTINVYEFLAKVANQIKKEYGGSVAYAAGQFTARMNVMKNSVFELYRVIGESGAMKGMTDALNKLIKILDDPQVAEVIGNALGELFESIGNWIENLDASKVEEFFYTIAAVVGSLQIVLESIVGAFEDFNTDSQTPLLDAAEFITSIFMGLVDTIHAAGLLIKQLVTDIGTVWDSLVVDSTKGVVAMLNLEAKLDSATGGSLFTDNRRQEREKFLSDMAARTAEVNRQQSSADPDGNWSMIGNLMTGGDQSAFGKNESRFAEMRHNLEMSRLAARYKTPQGADTGTDYTQAMSDIDLQGIVDDLIANGANAPGGGRKGSKRDSSLSAFMRERTNLLKGISQAETEYQNILSNQPEVIGENVAKIRTLITEDERYMKLSGAQKTQLLALAKTLDDLALKKEMLIKVTKYENETMQESAEIQEKINQLKQFGYASQYNEASSVKNSFGKGGENEFLDEMSRQRMLASAMKRDADARNLDMEQYAANLRKSNEELLFQQSLYGKTAMEAEKLRKFHEIDLWLQEKSVGATQEQLELYKQLAEVLKGEVVAALEEVNQKQASITDGIKAGMARYMDEAGNASTAFADLAYKGIKGLEDAFVEFITTGKTSFKDLARMMLIELARVIIQLYIIKPLVDYISKKMESSSSESGDSGGGWVGALVQGIMSFFGGGSQRGNVFDSGGMAKFAKGGSFTNGMVNSPTRFNIGEMGEAGPEAIMPLSRNSKGQLGVHVAGSSGGMGDINVNTTIVISDSGDKAETNSDEKNARQLSDLINQKVKEVLVNERRNGGILWGMQNGR